jgi:hypothetical protein
MPNKCSATHLSLVPKVSGRATLDPPFDVLGHVLPLNREHALSDARWASRSLMNSRDPSRHVRNCGGVCARGRSSCQPFPTSRTEGRAVRGSSPLRMAYRTTTLGLSAYTDARQPNWRSRVVHREMNGSSSWVFRSLNWPPPDRVRVAPVATSAMTASIEHAWKVMVVVVARAGWLIGGSFDVIDVELALPIGRSRIWHVSGTTVRTRARHDARAQCLRAR